MKARRIELKAVPAMDDAACPVEQPFSYRDGIKSVLRFDQRGFTAEEVLKSMCILGDLKGATDALILAQTAYEFLLGRVNGCHYAVASEALAEFIKDVRSAPETVVEPKT